MPIVYQKDAIMNGFDFMFRAVFKNTYSAFQIASGLGFGCYSFRRLQARTPRCDFGLNWPPMLISIFTFSSFFSNFFWPFQQCFVHIFGLPLFCAYNRMSLGQNLGIKPYALKNQDLLLITIIKLPYLHQI